MYSTHLNKQQRVEFGSPSSLTVCQDGIKDLGAPIGTTEFTIDIITKKVVITSCTMGCRCQITTTKNAVHLQIDAFLVATELTSPPLQLALMKQSYQHFEESVIREGSYLVEYNLTSVNTYHQV
jgi:hypothetical protein